MGNLNMIDDERMWAVSANCSTTPKNRQWRKIGEEAQSAGEQRLLQGTDFSST